MCFRVIYILIKDNYFIFMKDVVLVRETRSMAWVPGYLITTKPVHTIKNETMYLHTFIDAAGDWLDTVFFPQVANYSNVNGKGFYSMKGKVVEEFGVYSVEVTYCKRIGIKDRAQKANELMSKDKSYQQILVERP